MDIDKILIDLEVIGQLRGSDKLAVMMQPGESRLIINTSSFLQGLRRWYAGNDRESALNYVSDLVDKCHKAANVISSGNHKEMSEQLKVSLIKAKEGLSMLNTTYSDDSIVVAKILLILSKMERVQKILEAND